MRKKKKQISMEANRFKNVSELIKSFEEYSGFSIDPEEIDTRDKLLDKISEIQDYLSNYLMKYQIYVLSIIMKQDN